MGFFKKNKENAKDSSVPDTFPDTLIDKSSQNSMNTNNFSGEINDKLNHQNQSSQNISASDKKRIPQEILNNTQNTNRMPSSEIRYVTNYKPDEELKIEIKDNTQKDKSIKKNVVNSSFLSKLHEHIKSNPKKVSVISPADLVSKMKEFHDSVNYGHDFFIHEQDAETQIEKKIRDIKEIEDDWLLSKKEVESAESKLLEKELELQNRFAELKKLMTSVNNFKLFNSVCEPSREFVLLDGEHIKSIKDLMYKLADMSDATYYHHVNNSRNDFSNWIRYVFGAQELADAIRFSENRQDMLNLLKTSCHPK